jgi:MFS family permease
MSDGTETGAAPAAAKQAAPSFGALRHPAYRAYFLTSALAMMGDNIEHVISYWMLYERFRSPALGGIAILTHWLPFLLFSVHAGALADRFDCRRIIQAGAVLFAAVSIAWAVLFATGTIEVWHAVVLLTLHGFAGVLWSPAGQLLVHDIVGREHLQSAVRLNATARNLGLLLGPAVGGALLLALPPALGLLVNVLAYLPLIFWLRKAPGRAPSRPVTHGRAGFAEIAHVLRAVAADRTVVLMLVVAGASSLFIGNAIQAQMPEFAHDLGTEEADVSYSVLLAANAAGAFAGGVILESRGLLPATPRTALVLAVLWCFALTGFAAATSYPLAVALMLIAGFLNLAFNAMAQTLVQLRAPAALRGRLIGFYNMLGMGLRAFSGVTIGLAGALVGIHWSLAASALAMLVVAAVLLGFAMREQ